MIITIIILCNMFIDDIKRTYLHETWSTVKADEGKLLRKIYGPIRVIRIMREYERKINADIESKFNGQTHSNFPTIQ